MMHLRQRFESALKETVDEWKNHKRVVGIFVYGSYVRSTATANSDLDICIVWDADEAPVRLLSMHKEVRIDMLFITADEVKGVLERTVEDTYTIAGVVGRLRGARVVHDTKNRLKKWQEQAADYAWSDTAIQGVKEKALEFFSTTLRLAEQEEAASAIFTAREGMFQLGWVTLMTNNIFDILKPSEILSEVRMLDPITYRLFLRAYKLKDMNETKLLSVLDQVREWLDKAETRLGNAGPEIDAILVTTLLAQAQRDYFGALGLTYAGDYELAVLEMRQAMCTLGRALVALHESVGLSDEKFITRLRDIETDFYNDILMEHGAYDIQLSEIMRIVGEAEFIIERF